jgi:hypothetical protein
MNALVSKQSIEQICAARDETLRRFDIAFGHIATAGEAVAEAMQMWEVASPGRNGHWSDQDRECKSFFSAVSVPHKDEYRRTARKLVDVTVWTHLIEMSGIEALMDAQAKRELRDQMRYVPDRTDRDGQLINQEEIAKMLPEVTVENVYATLEQFRLNAELIFRRGIVNVFSKLDRRFRSHDGFKVGSRMILNNIANSWGSVSNYGERADLLHDVERTFLVLDGQDARANYASLLARVDRERNNHLKPMQSEHEGDYFKIRIFKNGNAHLWFTRKDLVEKVNKILADHYGEVIGDGMTKEADPLQDKKLTPAKRFGFYPSPDEVAERVIRNAHVLRGADKEQLRILEPSAGTGNLARRCITNLSWFSNWSGGAERYAKDYRLDNLVDCVEIQPELAHQLQQAGIYNRVTCADFLAIRPNPARLYDRVVMNPPFDRERDIDHVMHALDFLKPDGCLIAVMSAGTEFRETKKSVAFRALMEKMGAAWDDLPAGSFAEVGTYVNTLLMRVWKDGRRQYGLDR